MRDCPVLVRDKRVRGECGGYWKPEFRRGVHNELAQCRTPVRPVAVATQVLMRRGWVEGVFEPLVQGVDALPDAGQQFLAVVLGHEEVAKSRGYHMDFHFRDLVSAQGDGVLHDRGSVGLDLKGVLAFPSSELGVNDYRLGQGLVDQDAVRRSVRPVFQHQVLLRHVQPLRRAPVRRLQRVHVVPGHLHDRFLFLVQSRQVPRLEGFV